MLNRKKGIFNRLVIFTVVIGLCITALQIGAVSTTISNSAEYEIYKIDSTHSIKEKRQIDKTLTKVNTVPIELNPRTSYRGIPIITTEEDCQNPAIATYSNNILVMAEESQSILTSDLLMIYSSDGGNSWSDIIFDFATDDVMERKPVIDYCDNNEFQAYGTCLPDQTGALYFIHFPSMTDPEVPYKDSEGWTIFAPNARGWGRGWKSILSWWYQTRTKVWKMAPSTAKACITGKRSSLLVNTTTSPSMPPGAN